MPCVYLDKFFQADDNLYIYGYPDDYPQGASVTGKCEGIARDDQLLIKFKEGQVRPGLSGSPLLNQRTGKVCGIVKFTRDRSFDLGGGAVPSSEILSHFLELEELQQRFHRRDARWTKLLPSPSSKTHLSRQEYKNRQALLNKVNRYWIKDVLEKSLHDQVLIELGLEERPGALAHPWNMDLQTLDGVLEPLPQGTKLIELFDQIGEGRTLIILGEPGSGKTTMLLELARDLISRAEEDVDHLIPVIFNLSSWAIKKQKIGDWLIDELNSKYQVPTQIGQILVKEEALLLLLDGLDEVQAEYREQCVEALNEFTKVNSEIVVCSRIQDYEFLSNRLNFQRAVYLKLLTSEQILDYLDSIGSDFESLKKTIKEEQVLQQLASSPLMLNIMTITYNREAIDIFSKNHLLEEYRQQLIDQYIERMLNYERIFSYQQPSKTQPQYSKSQVKHWLIWLAQRMEQESQTEFLIEKIQPSWLTNNSPNWIYRLGIRWLVGTIVSLVIGVIAIYSEQNLKFAMVYSLIAGLCFAVVWESTKRITFTKFERLKVGVGLPEGILFGLLFALARYFEVGLEYGVPQAWQSLIIRILGFIFMAGNLAALAVGFVQTTQVNLVENLSLSLRTILRRGLPIGLLIGLLSGLWGLGSIAAAISITLVSACVLGLELPQEINSGVRANQGIWDSLRNSLRWGVTLGLAFGIGIAVTPGNWDSGLSYGLIAVLVLGMALGGFTCLQHALLRFNLWWFCQIPWNYASFLDYADNRFLLRKVGGSYIFVHRLVQEHFAAMSRDWRIPSELSAQQRRKNWLTFGIIFFSISLMLFCVTTIHHRSETSKLKTSQLVQQRLLQWNKQGRPIHIDNTGDLIQKNNEKTTLGKPVCCFRDFIAEVEFFNPYERWWKGTWRYGLKFRVSDKEEYHLYVRADKTWEFWGFDEKDIFRQLNSGRLNNLDVSADGSNTLKWIVKDQVAYFWVNQNYITRFKTKDNKTPGILTIGIDFYYYESANVNGEKAKFNNFSVKSLDHLPWSFNDPLLLSAEEWITLGNNFSNHGLNDDGINACKNAAIQDPGNPNAFFCQGLLYYRLEEYDKAIKLYDDAIKINKQENWEKLKEAFIRKGWSLYLLKEYEKALEAFEIAIGLDKKNAWAIRGKGFSLFELKSEQESLEAFEKAIKFDSKESWSWKGKGDILFHNQKYGQALKAYEKAIKIDQKNPTFWFWKGRTLSELKHYQGAIKAYDQALKHQPNLNEACYWREQSLKKLQFNTQINNKRISPWTTQNNCK